MKEFFNNILCIPKLVWIICIGSLLCRAGAYSVLPMFVLTLSKTRGVNVNLSGIIVACIFTAQVFGGFLAVYAANILKTKPLIIVTSSGYAISFLAMKLAIEYIPDLSILIIFLCLIGVVNGVLSSLIDSVSQAIISKVSGDYSTTAFSLRYTLINVGVAIGPFLTILISGNNISTIPFYVTTAYVLIYPMMLLVVTIENIKLTSKVSLITSMKYLLKNKQFIVFTITGILGYFVYSFQDLVLVYIIQKRNLPLHIFTTIYIINGITIIFLQMILIHYTSRYNIHRVIVGGFCSYFTSFIIYDIAGQITYLYYISSFIFTIGEIFTLSIFSIYIDKYAPENSKIFYFSLNGLVTFGRTLGVLVHANVANLFGIHITIMMVAASAICGIITILLAQGYSSSRDRYTLHS